VLRRNVWLASYPKSGNTWMRLALSSLHAGGRMIQLKEMGRGVGELLTKRSIFDEALNVDSSDLSLDEISRLRPLLYPLLRDRTGQFRIWKTHDAWERSADGVPLFPAGITAVALYIVRDPREVAVSLAHHMGCDLDAAISLMARVDRPSSAKHKITNQFPPFLSSWSGHVESWLDQSDLSPLTIRYEDMIADLAGVLTRVAALLDLPQEPAAIRGAVEATRFDRLRDLEGVEGFEEAPRKNARFFRSGLTGSWRDSLSTAQIARIERDHGAMMARLRYL